MALRTMTTFATGICTFVSFLLLIFALTVPQIASASYGEWYMHRFEGTIDVQTDGTMIVTERIQTSFAEDSMRRGIFRDIPYVYRTDLGVKKKIDIRLLSVLQNGEFAEYSTSRDKGYFSIKIGDPKVFVTGPVEYEITYEVDRAILFGETKDEIYWNVTGTEFEVPVEEAHAIVRLPDVNAVSVSCYTGAFGVRGRNCGISQSDSIVAFSATDALTVAVGIPKGVISPPSPFAQFNTFMRDNWVLWIPIIVFAFLFVLWWNIGRDPKMRTIVPEYAPPDNIPAGYAGFLVKHRFTSQMLTAMILWLATQGLFVITVDQEEKGSKMKVKSMTLKKTGKEMELDRAHKELMRVLFGRKDEVTLEELKKKDGHRFKKIHLLVKKHMHETGLYSRHSLQWRAGLVTATAIMLYVTLMLGIQAGTAVAVAGILTTIMLAVASIIMPQRSAKGTELARRVLGFKEYMHTAERYRSEWQEKQGIFAEYLPYAVAFNDVKHWAKVFEGLDEEPPDWYRSNLFVNHHILATSLISTSHAMSVLVAPKVSTSGGGGASSGGGFSGGGFGGGRSGSW